MDEKRALEHAAILQFIEAYNHAHMDNALDLLGLGDAPDGVVRQGSVVIGIEAAHVYGTNYDAKNTLGRAGDFLTMQRGDRQWRDHIRNSMISLPDRIIPALNRVVSAKARKRYGGACWLVIRNALPIWEKSDFEKQQSLIRLPRHDFQQMWLLCGRHSWSGLLRLA
jgi:hypothetical protein